MDKTLFDFDDEIDNLSEVSEIYQVPVNDGDTNMQ